MTGPGDGWVTQTARYQQYWSVVRQKRDRQARLKREAVTEEWPGAICQEHILSLSEFSSVIEAKAEA